MLYLPGTSTTVLVRYLHRCDGRVVRCTMYFLKTATNPVKGSGPCKRLYGIFTVNPCYTSIEPHSRLDANYIKTECIFRSIKLSRSRNGASKEQREFLNVINIVYRTLVHIYQLFQLRINDYYFRSLCTGRFHDLICLLNNADFSKELLQNGSPNSYNFPTPKDRFSRTLAYTKTTLLQKYVEVMILLEWIKLEDNCLIMNKLEMPFF